VVSLLRTIRPLEQAIAFAPAWSRVGRTSQPFATVALTSLVRADAGLWPDRRLHALGERELLCLLIALSFLKKRRPWFISLSNKALATVPSPSGMVGHFLKPQFRAQHERPGFLTARNHVIRPLGLALVDEPMAQLHGCASHF